VGDGNVNFIINIILHYLKWIVTLLL
jgi:uncharacterized membrane protein YqaE (UPF0057 family)